jgi:hypothetical protein
MSTDDAIRNAADEIDGSAERRLRSKSGVRGDRTGGAPIAPTGVPKADHVAKPLDADRNVGRFDATPEPGSPRTDPNDRF